MNGEEYCVYCGQKLVFRYIDGIVRPLHPEGACDGRGWLQQAKAIRKQCPKCAEVVFYVTHNGGFFWVDALGPPWPRHPCFPAQPSLSRLPPIKAGDLAPPTAGMEPATPGGIGAIAEQTAAPPSGFVRQTQSGRQVASKAIYVPPQSVVGPVPKLAKKTKKTKKKQLPDGDLNVSGQKGTGQATAPPGEPGLRIVGLRKSEIYLARTQILQMRRAKLELQYRGETVPVEYVSLASLFDRVLSPLDDGDRDAAPVSYVLVSGRGAAVFSWAELDATFMDSPVVLILRWNGGDLPAELGPYWLAAMGERVDVRSIRGVQLLKLVRVTG